MFDSIVLNRSIDGPAITIGEIAEALLFYQNIHIVMDTSNLLGLIQSIGPHNIIRLLSHPDVKTTYIEEILGVMSDETNFGTEYTLASGYFSGNQEHGEIKSWKKRLEFMLTRQGLNKTQAENFTERFRQCVTLKRLTGDHFIHGGVISAAKEDFNDPEYVSSAARIILRNLLPKEKAADEFYFRIHPSHGTFRVSTNIDFPEINRYQKNVLANNDETTPASIASSILNSSYGLILAAHYGGDFHTSTTESKIIQQKNKQILTRANANRNELSNFYEIALTGCPDIATVINKGERSFEEFLELLTRAKKFKKWLKEKSPDEKLLSQYLEDITTSSWFGSGSGKALRYLASNGLGLIDPITGLLTSALDCFILDKLTAGWKPNQFIIKKIKPFVDIHDNG